MIYGTACIIRNKIEKSKILLCERLGGKKDMHNSFWVPPGGKREPGESSFDCNVREVFEETNLKIINPTLRATVFFNNKGRILNGKLNPESWMVDFFEASEYKGKLKPYFKWIEENSLSKINIYEGDRQIFELLKHPGTFKVELIYDKEKLIHFYYEYAKK